ncbi:N-terminal phage integrase SAM-like domain-containing protein [Brevibacillus porteri]|uniref:N-terminal phage integrase SAM-like domain-containing protein n=1 Tax=Brevibacillus porteri TaxID=2126350 RepID=UPI001FC914C3|nr:N-terminal phage integrase SAM-like domain-containing protein [Brevibacillus porteri]MED1803025.1 N-terminal phage integrase SAM-like domain-containing protein [Brevibacillus porteri]MED2135133.1 N-terminal phage integrase SAM-like domain-containing protein [Brevibacillus porteri]MED2745775.1 N-terminal phage integrase SAM-like domain-containing protein [Brevibacillus porteri]MED2813761.1 N-terminal phage integrase SAM-like domain-containing protein [Brevibacillus porteri]MED2897769.1 N-ter
MGYLKRRILPVFGHMRLDQIKPFHIVRFISELGDSGSRQDGQEGCLAPGTIRYIPCYQKYFTAG